MATMTVILKCFVTTPFTFLFALKHTHKGRDQLKRDDGVKKSSFNTKKSLSVNAFVKATMSIVDTTETDDDDNYDPWKEYIS